MPENYLGYYILLLFLMEVFTLLKLEKVMWGTYYTPFFFLAIPFTLVMLLTVILGPILGFVSYYFPSLWVWILGLFLFWIPGFVLRYTIYNSTPNDLILKFEIKSFYSIRINILTWGILIILMLRLVYCIKELGFANIGGAEFGFYAFGHGLFAHLRIFMFLLFMYQIVTYKNLRKSFSNILIIILLSSIYLSYTVKGWLLIPLVAGILIRLSLGKTKLSLRLILYTFIGGICFFFISYFISLIIFHKGTFDENFSFFVLKHFSFYLFAGNLCFSQNVLFNSPSGLDFNVIIAPLVNIFNYINGNELINVINQNFVYVGNGYSTNVNTFFGTLFIFGGFLSIPYILIFGYFMYLLFYMAHLNKNIWIYFLLFFYNSILCFGWFEFYLFHLEVFELPIFALILMIIMNPSFKYRLSIKQAGKNNN
jgi:hypothetical protein